MKKYELSQISPVNFLFLFLTPILSAFMVYFWIQRDGFEWGQVFLGVIFYVLTGISITAGYHRLFAHKAYDAHPIVKLFFLLFGAAAFQNSVLKWGSDHRRHHIKVDSPDDPYSIKEGFFYAHMGWIILKENGEINNKYANDFLKDNLILWQHKYYLQICVLVGLVLPAIMGEIFFHSWLGGLAIAGFSRLVLVHHSTFFINSLCHCVGTTPYTDANSARDSWFMAFLTFGEGYHNFHHFFQADYRNGINWYQFDPTKWLIRILESIGLASKLKLTPQDIILSARMQMKVKSINFKISKNEKLQEELEQLKRKVLESLKNFQELKNQYKISKKNEIKERMKLARAEFYSTLEAWNQFINYLNARPMILSP